MANPYFTPTGNPATLSRGASSVLRAEYTLIGVGFDSVYTAIGTTLPASIALKGNITNQTWLGTHAFPATTSIGTVTAAEIARLVGVTSGIQGQIDTLTSSKGAIAGQTWAGTHDFSGASILVPTQITGTATTAAASCAFVVATAFASALPGQAGNAGKYVTTDGTNASWATITPPEVKRSARTSNTILGTADRQNLIDITSGTFSQTFDAAATLTDGWYCWIRNAGTGDITLDPNGAETIDGLTNFIMYPGEARLVQCDGTGFYSQVVAPFTKIFTSTATFTTPPGYKSFEGLLWGGGGGGGKSNALAVQVGGGGGGACVPFYLTSAQLGASQTVTIGAGGTAQAGAGDGGIGGTSSIGALALAYGGGGGGGNAADRCGGGGGGARSAGTTGTASAGVGGGPSFSVSSLPNGSGLSGANGMQSTADTTHAEWGGGGGGNNAAGTTRSPGDSIFGGGGGAGVNAANNAGAGGTSKFGGAGGASSSASSGSAGTAPAGGGGATQTGATSGAGGAGQCTIWGVA